MAGPIPATQVNTTKISGTLRINGKSHERPDASLRFKAQGYV